MNRIKLITTLILLFGCWSIYAQNSAVTGYCVKGATPATTSGLNSTNTLQGIVPGGPAGCLVQVYISGTVTSATIYSTVGGTVLTNPFRAATSGQWLFFAVSGTYDVVLSGGLPPNAYSSPVTLTGLQSGTGGSGTGSAVQVNGGSTLPTANLTNANGFSFANPSGALVNIGVDGTHYLPTTTDESNWNGKQAAGNYITGLTGDGTASGPGSVVFTLATVNTNVGSCGDATHVGQVTLNAKGLATACTPVSITGTGGFPIVIGSTSIAASSTTTSITGLTLDGVTPTTFGFLDATSSIQTQLNSKAPTASPTFTGTVTTPALTLSTATGSTQCLQVNTSGVVAPTGAPCGSGGGGITALTGDVTASGSGSVTATVKGINGTLLSGLATGILKNTTTTGVPSIATAGTDYQVPITLTTTGSSGAATLSGGTLNIPNYSGGGSGITGATSGQALIAGSATTATSSKALAGSGAGLTTGPVSGVVSGNFAGFTGTGGQIADSGFSAANFGILVNSQTWSGVNTFSGGVALSSYFTLGGSQNLTAIQGSTGTKLLAAGTVSGTGASLCTDASGNATTTGCTSGGSGTVNTGTIDGAAYYTGTTAVSSTTAPTTTGRTFVLAWQPSGSVVAPAPLDLGTYLASPPAIGATAPANITGTTIVATTTFNSISYLTPALGTATSGANFGSGSYGLNGSYWTGSVSNTDSWNWANILGTGANPTTTLTATHSAGSTGFASVSVPNLVVTSQTGSTQCASFNTNGNLSGTGAPCGSSGGGITALTGDGTASGSGSVAFTLATVNSNVGSFGSSTSIPSFTVNAKGLITAASGNVVIAPAGTLSGTTLNSTVVSSSLTSLGTITSLLASNITDSALTSGHCVQASTSGLLTTVSVACGTGNTTSTSLTTNVIPKANGANSIINSALDDGASTANTLTYTGSAGELFRNGRFAVGIPLGFTPQTIAGGGFQNDEYQDTAIDSYVGLVWHHHQNLDSSLGSAVVNALANDVNTTDFTYCGGQDWYLSSAGYPVGSLAPNWDDRGNALDRFNNCGNINHESGLGDYQVFITDLNYESNGILASNLAEIIQPNGVTAFYKLAGFNTNIITTPSAPSGTPSTTGGTVVAGSNYAKLVGLDFATYPLLPPSQHSAPGTESSVVTTTGSTSSIAWTWTPDPSVLSYQFWVGSTSNGEANYFIVNPAAYESGYGTAAVISGATVPAGTYYFRVVVIDALGNKTLVGASDTLGSVTTTSPQNAIIWSCPATAQAVSYQIWVGSSPGAEVNYFTFTPPANNPNYCEYMQTLPTSSGTSGTTPTYTFLQTTPISSGTGGTIPTTNTTGLINGVALSSSLASTVYLDGTGKYSTPSGGNTTSTSLTTNTVPRANGANSLIDSAFTDNGTVGGYARAGGFGPTHLFSADINTCADTSGSGTAQVCNTVSSFTPTGNPSSCVVYQTTTTNSGTGLTLNVNSLSAKSIAIPGASGWTTTLTAGIIPANKPSWVCYDGTNWDYMQTGTSASGGSGVTGSGTAFGPAYWNTSTTVAGLAPPTTGTLWWLGTSAAPRASTTSDTAALSISGNAATTSAISGMATGQVGVAGSSTSFTSSIALAGTGTIIPTETGTFTNGGLVLGSGTAGEITGSSTTLASIVITSAGSSRSLASTLTQQLMPEYTVATVASSTTIAPTTPLVIISGTTTISTITAPSGTAALIGATFDFETTSAVPFTTGGNIATSFTTTAATLYRCVFMGTTNGLWYCK